MPRRRLGQHFLKERRVAARIVAAAELVASDTVVEIGPGRGALTGLLAPTAERLILIEADSSLARALASRYARAIGIEVLAADAREFTPEWAPGLLDLGYKVVANLPYYAASPIVRRFLESPARPSLMVVMVQREVGEEMAARPGRMGLLSVAVQLYAEVEQLIAVPPGAFDPQPRVHSTVLRLNIRPRPALDLDSNDHFMNLVRAGFAAPRKQLHNSLARGLDIAAGDAAKMLEAAGIDSTRRPATLSLDEWGALYRAAAPPTGL